MAGAYKRSDVKTGRYRIWYVDERGKRAFAVGYTDRKASLKLAEELEQHARRVREGLVEPGERKRKAAAAVPLADHAEEWRLHLIAKGDTRKHAVHQSNAAAKLLAASGATYPDEVAHDRVVDALGRMKADGKSPRTRNHALGAVKAFVRWLVDANRLKEAPRGLLGLESTSEEVDRRRVRRALSGEELDRLLAAAEAGEPVYVYGPTKSKAHKVPVTGAERATIYRLAMGTGFRAKELRSLRPEWFHLDGDDPKIVIPAEFTKNGKPAPQPIRRELAAGVKAYIESRDRGRPALTVPDRTAQMLRVDLKGAGIPYRDGAGRVVDFHALRHSYVTHLVRAGLSVAVVQRLARHSTPTLTLARYTHVEEEELRKALEGEK